MNTFSIIIPHHGPEEQLDRCAGSIPKRDDVQVIVIMDDECRGAGWARNKGLEKATGDYVIFADSDDFFLDGLDDFLDDHKHETADMVIFNACSIDEGTNVKSWRANHLNSIIDSKDPVWQERHLRYHFTEPWCRLIKHSLIKEQNIRFGESKIVNDIYFSTRLGLSVQSVKVDKRKIYCVCNNKNSTGKKKGKEYLIDATRQIAKSNVLLKSNGISHYHSRMLRPFFTALLQGQFTLARECVEIIKEEGYTGCGLLKCLLHYPIDISKLLKHKIVKREFALLRKSEQI